MQGSVTCIGGTGIGDEESVRSTRVVLRFPLSILTTMDACLNNQASANEYVFRLTTASPFKAIPFYRQTRMHCVQEHGRMQFASEDEFHERRHLTVAVGLWQSVT